MKLEKMYQPKASPSEPTKIDVSDISIQRLIDDGLLILYREMHNLKLKSVQGKLGASDARDVRDHLKLLFELKNRENDLLRGLTDEELEKKLHDGSIKNQSPVGEAETQDE